MQQLQLSKNWRLEQRADELYVLGGQDAIFTIELEPQQHSFFADLKHSQKFQTENLSATDKIVLEQLLSAAVILPVLDQSKNKLPSVRLLGNHKLLAQFGQIPYIAKSPSKQPDLIVLVRSHETLQEFLTQYDYLKLKTPHLFLDLAYHHTISLGPLVFPGITACVACLEGRLKTRWGDEQPPAQPKSSEALLALAGAWLDIELRALFADEDYTLVNKTVVMDTQDRSLTHHKLLTVPLCPYCQKTELLASGKIAYTAFKA